MRKPDVHYQECKETALYYSLYGGTINGCQAGTLVIVEILSYRRWVLVAHIRGPTENGREKEIIYSCYFTDMKNDHPDSL